MESIQLRLETVTPMFLHGYDNKILELRPPAFKALFRYWWRAIAGKMDADKLSEREGDLFGNTKKRSPLSVRISGFAVLQSGEYAPLPHKPDLFTSQAYLPNGRFNLILTASQLDEYEKIAKLGFLLGGVGNRSRRGFGSIRYQDWSFQTVAELEKEICQTLDVIAPGRFHKTSNEIQIDSTIRRPDYPVIQAIYFGVNSCGDVDSLLRQIGQATHKYCDEALGGINPRMASPIHIRIQKVADQFVPVITQLNSVFPGADPHDYERKQRAFINSILK